MMRLAALLVLAITIVITVAKASPVRAYSYIGTGWWETTTLIVYHFGPTDAGHLDAQWNARADWWNRSARLTLLQGFDPGNYNIGTVAGNYGGFAPYGTAFLCAPDVNHCGSLFDPNAKYAYAEARLNRDAGTDGWEPAKKQAAYAHELGHTLSLAHNGGLNDGCEDCLMHPHIGWDGFPPHPGFYDRGVRGPTADEIAGINARY